MTAFASLLEKTPKNLRRVRYLFVCDTAQPSFERYRYRALEESWKELEEAGGVALVQILEAVSPTLETIHGVFLFEHNCCLLPVALPALTHLTLYHHYRSKPLSRADFPALRYLSLVECPHLHKIDFKWIGMLAPGLKHLHVTAAHPLYEFDFVDFAVLIDKVLAGKILPASVEKFFIELPRLEGMELHADHDEYMNRLERLEKEYKQVVLLPSQPGVDTNRDAEAKWLLSIP